MIPLTLFVLDLADNLRRGVGWDSLWMCHQANLLMGLGSLLKKPYWVSVGILWMVVGTPLWVRELSLDPSIGLTSYLAHLGGLAWALWSVRRQPRPKAWLAAWGFFVGVREFCRQFTPVPLNVNAAHQVRDLERVLPEYWQYWLVTTLACAGCLWTVDHLLKGPTADAA